MAAWWSWGRAYSRHLEAEIGWLREELRYTRDESARLHNVVASLTHGMTISTTAPSVPRVVEPVTRTAADVRHDSEFHAAGTFDEEPDPRAAL